ncbi:MAG: hypothetical protein EOP49_25205, partial [Sphingobacteriales bacterium]
TCIIRIEAYLFISCFNNAVVRSDAKTYSGASSINYNVGTTLQFSNFTNFSIRKLRYDYNSLPDNTFKMISNSLSLTTLLPNDFRFSMNSNIVYNANSTIAGANRPLHTAGASFEKLFLKKDLIFKASISDIFNNSRNSSRFASDTYIQETVNIGMRRYFLMNVSYRLRKFGS